MTRSRYIGGLLAIAAAAALTGCGSTVATTASAVTSCAFQADGHNALVVFRSNTVNIARTCRSFQRTNSDWRPVTMPSSLDAWNLICRQLGAGGSEHAVVYDTGMAIYGQGVCSMLTSNGWTQPVSQPTIP